MIGVIVSKGIDYAGFCMPRPASALAYGTGPPAPPRPPHTLALGAPGERTGANAGLGKRGAGEGSGSAEIEGVFSIFGNVRRPGSLLQQVEGKIPTMHSRH